MKILTPWLRAYLPNLPVTDRELAEALTLRGIAVEGEHPLDDGTGTLYEMDITTNRVDAMNHYGVAREVAAIYELALEPLDRTLPPVVGDETFPVEIDASVQALCGRFTTRMIRGVTVGASRGLMAQYFAALGQRPIWNAVDATNYTLLGMGHPTHAFDLDKVDGAIVVRFAREGEKLRLLDGTERSLAADDLVVADRSRALGLAGVMGGWDSMITAETKNVLVEAAWFDPATIRRSARRHGLHTDASHRFERGADFDAAPAANDLVTQMIVSQCGGKIAGPLVDVWSEDVALLTAKREPVMLSSAEVRRHLGTTVDPEGLTTVRIERMLTALGCGLTVVGADEFSVTLPSWRLDLERPIDLIEEVARVYGYNGFANTLPSFSGGVVAHASEPPAAAVRARLLALGFSETVSSTFTSADEAAVFAAQTGAVAMENPLSAEAGLLRPSLLPGMAAMIALNLNRDVDAVRAFEAGTVFSGSAETVHEEISLALGLSGSGAATALYVAADAPFYELKGAVESLVSLFAPSADRASESAAGLLAFSADGLPGWVEAGRGAVVTFAGKPLGVIGQLSAAEQARRKLRQTAWLAEIALAKLFALPLRQVLSRDLSRFQAVTRDFSFIFADATPWGAIEAALRGLAIAELRSVAPGEIFRDAKGKAVAPGHYSLLVQTVFQSVERTLQEDELSGWSQRIVAALTELGGQQRA